MKARRSVPPTAITLDYSMMQVVRVWNDGREYRRDATKVLLDRVDRMLENCRMFRRVYLGNSFHRHYQLRR